MEKMEHELEIVQVYVRVCDDCKDWFKPQAGPDDCPTCGRNGLRWVAMVPANPSPAPPRRARAVAD